MSAPNEMAAFVALCTVERFKQHRRRGLNETDAVSLAAWDAWEFIESLSESDLPDDWNAVDKFAEWIALEAVALEEA